MKLKRDITAVVVLFIIMSLGILGTALGQTTSNNSGVDYTECAKKAEALSKEARTSVLTDEQGGTANFQVPQDFVSKKLENGNTVSYAQLKSSVDGELKWKKVTASTYGIGDGLLGSGCADGSKVTKKSLGVAHKTLKLGTKLQLKYNGRILNATVVDRGPYIDGRELDLQPAVAKKLGFDGVHKISYRIID